jgi:hypothetical protein
MSLEQQIEDYVNNALSTRYQNCLVQGGNYEKNYCIGFSDGFTGNSNGMRIDLSAYNTKVILNDLSGDHLKVFTKRQPFTIKSSVLVEDGVLSTKNLVVNDFAIGKNKITYSDASNDAIDVKMQFVLDAGEDQSIKLGNAIGNIVYEVTNRFNNRSQLTGTYIPARIDDYSEDFTHKALFGNQFENNECIFAGEINNISNTDGSYDQRIFSLRSYLMNKMSSIHPLIELSYDIDAKESDFYCTAYFGEPDDKQYRQIVGFDLYLPLKLKISNDALSVLNSNLKINDYDAACPDLDVVLNKQYVLYVHQYGNNDLEFELKEHYGDYYGDFSIQWTSLWDFSKNEPRHPIAFPQNFIFDFSTGFVFNYHTGEIDFNRIDSASDIAYQGNIKSVENTYSNLQRAVQKSNAILDCFEVSDDQTIESLINKTLYQ